MRSRAVQLVLIAVAAAAVAGAAVFIDISEQHTATTRSAERGFDAVVRQVTNSVAEFRSEGVTKSLDALRSMATTDRARTSLEQATSKAADFTEIAAVLDQVNAARVAEQEATDSDEASQRTLEAMALAGAALIGLAAMGGIFLAAPRANAHTEQAAASLAGSTATPRSDELVLRGEPDAAAGYVTSRPAGPVLQAASQLCTDLGRVSDVEELRQLVGRAADLMDASGLIVWTSAPAHALPAYSSE